ncbi:protein tesmin/TSO1-like CXC 2 [Mercurialis annua]|uniref:protein tesmin/TSO1-like CXC 2 n=1 Tax=Mercurialis annua TaxID=3986 RepID=UPI00215FDFA4|nr:protein tesmin/TSO1-like CXC 2 [Mercurialis annua]
MMGTPEKTQITTPLSKFEDSPVFNYINSLSPIRPVKSTHVTQTFQSLSFSTLPSIFTSPHVSSHKESRFLRRHNGSDPSKAEFSSENGKNSATEECEPLDVTQLHDNSSELHGNFDARVTIGEGSAEPSNEHAKFAIELPTRLKYNCGSPENDTMPHCGPQMDCLSKLTGMSISQNCSSEAEACLQGMYRAEQKKEVAECDWENMITDAADLLIFNSPVDTESFNGLLHKSVDPHANFPDEVHDMQMDAVASCEQHEMEHPSTQPGETIEAKEMNQTWDNLAANNNPNEEVDTEVETSMQLQVVSNLHRGMRRRCLDFEMVGARRKNIVDGSTSSNFMGRQSEENFSSEDKQLVPFKPDTDSSRRILPGIGLHLNALAISSKESKNVKLENMSCGISLVRTVAFFHSPTNDEELNEPSTLASERDLNPCEDGLPLVDDVYQTSSRLVAEEFNHNSPKKKRRKVEGESDACKRCNCKKSKCLKLYCECFAAGIYCIEPCSCQDCFNKPIHEDTVLATRKQIESRNPLAFAPKVIRNTEPVAEIGDESTKTPASARHKRGCNCKKSSCLKKYCECYQGGVGCSINCRCEGCKNAFGRKDGSALTETEAEPEEEIEGDENNGIDKARQNIEIENNEEQNPNSALPATPLRLCRPLLQLPFSSKSKPPRSFLGIGSSSSSGLYTGQMYSKPNILRPQQKNQLETVPDDELPEILRGNYTPTTGIKTSPNSKRVSPPQSTLGSSPGLRSGRKLILQSIPSFPSLTPQH